MDSFENQIITAIKKIRNSNDNEMLKRFLKPSQKDLLQTKTWWRAANATRHAVKFQADKYTIPKFGIIVFSPEWHKWHNYN